MIRGSLDNKSVGLKRFEGYKTALLDNDINYDNSLVIEGNFKIKAGYVGMSKLLSLNGNWSN